MKVKDVRLHLSVKPIVDTVILYDQEDLPVCRIPWGKYAKRTKSQAIAIAKWLCDRFNAGQEK